MVALFDLDGVITDTESQYSLFWNRMGKDYLGLEDFGMTIKGLTCKTLCLRLNNLEVSLCSKSEIPYLL